MIKINSINTANPARQITFGKGVQSYSNEAYTQNTDMVNSNPFIAFKSKMSRIVDLFSPEVSQRANAIHSGLKIDTLA